MDRQPIFEHAETTQINLWNFSRLKDIYKYNLFMSFIILRKDLKRDF